MVPEPIIFDRYPLEPFSFRSADEVLRDHAVDSNAATLEDVDDRVDNGLSSNGLPGLAQYVIHEFKKCIESAVELVVIALQEEGEDLWRCRQHAIELEENKLERKRQMILMKKRRAGRWSPTRKSKNGRIRQTVVAHNSLLSSNSLQRSIRRHRRNNSLLRYL